MKSPQEILLETKTVQLQQAQAEKNWSDIIRKCRTPAWPEMLNLFAWPLVVAVIWFNNPQNGGIKPIYIIAFVFMSIALVRLVISFRKREQGLLAAIQQEAPYLYQKLKQDRAV